MENIFSYVANFYVFLGECCCLTFWGSSTVLSHQDVFRYVFTKCNYSNVLSFDNFRANWVIVNGTKYQAPCVLNIGKTEDEDFLFGKVVSILIHSHLNLLFLKLKYLSHTSQLTTILILYQNYQLCTKHTSQNTLI